MLVQTQDTIIYGKNQLLKAGADQAPASVFQ